jgi:hypothetical protein
MAHRTIENAIYRLYDANSDLEHCEEELLKVILIAGFQEVSLDTVTIDEVIEALEYVFCYDQREVVESFKDPNDSEKPLTDFGDGSLFHWPKPVIPWPKTASRDFISKQLFTLKTLGRRFWRWRDLASARTLS